MDTVLLTLLLVLQGGSHQEAPMAAYVSATVGIECQQDDKDMFSRLASLEETHLKGNE